MTTAEKAAAYDRLARANADIDAAKNQVRLLTRLRDQIAREITVDLPLFDLAGAPADDVVRPTDGSRADRPKDADAETDPLPIPGVLAPAPVGDAPDDAAGAPPGRARRKGKAKGAPPQTEAQREAEEQLASRLLGPRRGGPTAAQPEGLVDTPGAVTGSLAATVIEEDLETLLAAEAEGDWRSASLWEIGLNQSEIEGFAEERIDTAGKLSDHVKRHGWTFLTQEKGRVLGALIEWKDDTERNHQTAQARRAEEAKPKPRARTPKPKEAARA